jgi:hypothetical protein
MWDYICPKCKREVKQKSHKCPYCGENYGTPLRVPPQCLKDEKALEEYVHKHVFPKISARQREYLTRFFTTIFRDGFESGTILTTDTPPGAWTSKTVTTGASLTVEPTNPHHGTYSLKSYIFSQAAWTHAYCRKDLGTTYSETPVYYRVYVYVDAFTSTSAEALRGFMHLRGSGHDMFMVGLDSSRHLRLFRFNNGSYIYASSTIQLSLHTWYCVEIKGVADTDGDGDGEVRVYLNGNEVSDLTFTNQIHDSYSGLRYVHAGCQDGYNTEATIYIDCVAVADTGPIGMEGLAYTLTISTTVGGTTDPAPGSYVYPEGASATVTAIPSSGYAFDHWELDGTNIGSVNPTVVTMDMNHTLLAVFTEIPPPTKHTLTVDSSPIQGVPFTIEKVS